MDAIDTLVFAHAGCDVEPVEPLNPALLVDPTVRAAPGAIADCLQTSVLPPTLPTVTAPCPTITTSPSSSIAVAEPGGEPSVEFTATDLGNCALELRLDLVLPPSGGDTVTVNYTTGSTVNVTGSTFNVNNNSTLNVTNNSTLVVNNSSTLTVAGNLVLTPVTLTEWTSDVTDLDAGSNSAWLLASADQHFRILSGLVGGVHGRVVVITNVGTKVILLANEGAGVVDTNKIQTSTTVGYYYLAPRHTVALRYIGGAVNRWRVAENSKEWFEQYEEISLTADTANVALNPTVEMHVINPDAEGWLITGLTNGLVSVQHTLRNGASDVGFWLAHNDVTSSAENRFFLPGGVNMYVPPRAQVRIQFDPIALRWRVFHVPARLAENQIGYGSDADFLTGSADLVRRASGQVGLAREAADVDYTEAPGVRTEQARTGGADTSEGDVVGAWESCATLGGDPYTAGRWEFLHTGETADTGGEFRLYTAADLAALDPYNLGFRVDRAGDFFFGKADGPELLLGTGEDGEVVDVTLAAPYLTLVGNELKAKCDLVAPLHDTVISITAADTAVLGRVHLISGTTDDYSISLPPAAGNDGKLLAFVVDESGNANKRYTLDAYDTEEINGATTRVLWAGESVVLLAQGGAWRRIAGYSRPMTCRLYYNVADGTFQSVATADDEKIPFNLALDGTTFMDDSANSQIKAGRSGTYIVTAMCTFCGDSSGAVLTAGAARMYITMPASRPTLPGISGSLVSVHGTCRAALGKDDAVEVYAYQDSGSTQYIHGGEGGSLTWLEVTEIITW